MLCLLGLHNTPLVMLNDLFFISYPINSIFFVLMAVLVELTGAPASLHSVSLRSRYARYALFALALRCFDLCLNMNSACLGIEEELFKTLLSLGPQHPATHGVLRLIPISHGEIIQFLSLCLFE